MVWQKSTSASRGFRLKEVLRDRDFRGLGLRANAISYRTLDLLDWIAPASSSIRSANFFDAR